MFQKENKKDYLHMRNSKICIIDLITVERKSQKKKTRPVFLSNSV